MAEADFDLVVIGAGVVGLAVAARAAGEVESLVLFERHESFGRETSSRNSEILHAGIYYESGTLKADLCVEGLRELYRLAEERGVPHRQCGKVIVAVTDDEVASLEALKARGETAGAEGLRMLSRAEVRKAEPNMVAVAGLLSPRTGIIDSHRLMNTFKQEAEAGGADLVFGAEVRGLERDAGLWRIGYRDAEEDGTVTARAVVNAAGLGAQDVMRLAGLDPQALGLRRFLCKGSYFSVGGPKRGMVSSLVYPSPHADLAGLGIHTVVDLGGGLKLGPDAVYVEEIDYTVDPSARETFCESVRPFLPWLEPEDLAPDMSGIRPKLAGPGEPARDFHIAHEDAAGAPGFFNMAGIESPGLTASPAIGRMVSEMIAVYLD